ncbi:Uncharacterised protein [Candidatus Tiddalikarchaeum anstoanum]|nr:Uncharacterised protein [Candidatus Tiddalikarchaeum anstoanum]
MAISDILSIAELIFTALNKLAFILLCFYFGNMAIKGWKGATNIIFKIAGTGVLGILCFIGGLTLETVFNMKFFLSDYLFSIVTAVILYFIMLLVSTGFKAKEKYATKIDVSSLSEDVKTLKIQVAKLTKALEDKNMIPTLLDEEGIKKALAKDLEKVGVKKYELLKCEKKEDMWYCQISSNKGKENLTLDGYTGSITGKESVKSIFEFLLKNPISAIGVVLFAVFVIFILSQTSISTINSINDAFNFGFLFPAALPEGCVQARSTIENFQTTSNSAITFNNTLISQSLPSGTYLIPSMTRGVRVNNQTYYLSTSYSTQIPNLGTVLTSSTLNNIYNVRVCVFKTNYTLCECIGSGQTDPVITVPYLVSLGVIEQALQSAILGSLGTLGGGLFQ